MTLSSKNIDLLRQMDEISVWNYVSALQQMQNAIFILEKETNDPEVLRDLATRAIEISKELKSILKLFADEEEEAGDETEE
jgi:hypothetical protein